MTAVTAAHLISQGSTCSICGQAFSAANPPTVTTLTTERFGGATLEKAICTNPPYVDKHDLSNTATDDADTTLKVVYQNIAASAGNPYAVLEILYKDMDP